MEFSNRLTYLRTGKKLSIAQLSDKAKITRRLCEYYENSKDTRIPSYKNIIKLASFFDCSADYLLCQTNDPTHHR